ncbi:acyltransferase family protein [Sphingomonas sp.]|uniref:acyltransferase family protein n=1 Tax=Sphingomonas sp. TaxID=28214 RepID=UPI003CC64927
MPELRQLTGARGVAAWAVVLYHVRLSVLGLPPPVVAVLAKGYLAVDFFFLLSGFVIWLAWHDRAAASPLRFWQKRVARIWPLHAAMLAFAALLAIVLALRGPTDSAFPWPALPLHLLLVQAWGSAATLRWNIPAWSISAELAAYLLFPLLTRLVNRRRWPAPALLFAAAAILAILPLAMGFGSLGRDIGRFGVLRCLCEFTAGTIIATLYRRGGGARAPLAVGLICLVAWSLGAPETLAVPLAFAALLLALARSRAVLLASRPVHWLGSISYATYLAHFLLWKAMRLPLAPGPQHWTVIAAYLLLVLFASHLLYRWLELPAQRWINGLALPRRNVRVAQALPGDGHQTRLLG